MFNPKNNNQIISVGQYDGIFIWDFNGDVDGDYKKAYLSGQDLPITEESESKAPSLLEKIRTANKAKKAFRNQMSEDSFIIPEFKTLDQANVNFQNNEFYDTPVFVKQMRDDRKLTYNHYCDCIKKKDMDGDTQSSFMNFSNDRGQILDQKLIHGYDGYGGVHDNLVWNVTGGFTYFTLKNKMIIENTKTREQTVFADSLVQLSCLASSVDHKLIAVGEGSINPQGISLIYLYDTEKKKLLNRLTFHQKGVQSMTFSTDSKYLITLGVQGEDALAIWDISSGLVVKSALLRNYATN